MFQRTEYDMHFSRVSESKSMSPDMFLTSGTVRDLCSVYGPNGLLELDPNNDGCFLYS